jgi:hypothetical protein
MALSQAVASELLEAFRAGEGVDLIREGPAGDAGADRDRSGGPDRRWPLRAQRHAYYRPQRHSPRLLSTQAWDVQLGIPKLRKGSFLPVILEPRRRIDQALYAMRDGGLRARCLYLRRR